MASSLLSCSCCIWDSASSVCAQSFNLTVTCRLTAQHPQMPAESWSLLSFVLVFYIEGGLNEGGNRRFCLESAVSSLKALEVPTLSFSGCFLVQ